MGVSLGSTVIVCDVCGYIAEHRDALLWHHGQRHYDPPTALHLELRRMIESPATYGDPPPRPHHEAERIGELLLELTLTVIRAPDLRRAA